MITKLVNIIQNIATRVQVKEKKFLTEIWVYLQDRELQSEDIRNILKDFSIEYCNCLKQYVSSHPVSEFSADGKKVRIVYKPAGGIATTTLHSTITELAPILMWHSNYSGPNDPKCINNVCTSVNLDEVTFFENDRKVAAKYVETFSTAPLFESKMNCAYHIYKELKDQYQPKEMVWCYRKKVNGLSKNSTADIYLKTAENKPIGVSIKAGEKANAKFHTLNTSFMEFARFVNADLITELKQWGWEHVYKQFADDGITSDNYLSNKAIVIEKLQEYDKNHLNEIGYYKIQEKVRDLMISEINERPLEFIDFLKYKYGVDDSIPIVTIIAYKKGICENNADLKREYVSKLVQTPVIASKCKGKSNFIVKIGDYSLTFNVRCALGGNKTAAFYDFKFSEIA